LLTILASPEARAQSVKEVSDLIAKVGGFDGARKKAVAAVESAIASLQVFSQPANLYERHVLEGLARYILIREK
jgi:geranylgeranyl pyrophosphate synthase